LLDDYAHHPTEIRATLEAVRKAIGERRLVVVYQPHRYSRAKECMGLYSNIFKDVDNLFITQIYSAGEEPIPGISHEKVIEEIKQTFPSCKYVAREDASQMLANFLRPHDVLVTLGAGDITKLCGEVMENFKLKAPPKLKVGLVFGGLSVEHEVSVMSARNVADYMEQEIYEPSYFGITREGDWIEDEDNLNKKEVLLPPTQKEKISSQTMNKLLACDIFFPVLHGDRGEDGAIQGFFDIFNSSLY
jgi:UDP-N-acetylmuramate--alanine ligase